jgi:hypothetical protein
MTTGQLQHPLLYMLYPCPWQLPPLLHAPPLPQSQELDRLEQHGLGPHGCSPNSPPVGQPLPFVQELSLQSQA